MSRHRLPRVLLVVLWVVLLAVIVILEADDLRTPERWDLLRDTGVVVFLGALTAALAVPGRFQDMLDRLPLAAAEPSTVSGVRDAVVRRVRICGPIGAGVGVAAMAAVWLWSRGPSTWASVLFWAEVVGAAAAGYLVGGFVAYGLLGRVLDRRRIRLDVLIGHPDGAAGLREYGRFYVRQALVVAMIGFFAGVWWLLITNSPDLATRYGRWRDPYLAIIGICLVLEIFILMVPLAWAHRLMAERRRGLTPDADRAGRRVAELEETIAADEQPDRATLTAERDRLQTRWTMITGMPTWPVDLKLRRTFSWSNAVLLLPLVLQWVKAPALLQQLAGALQSLQ